MRADAVVFVTVVLGRPAKVNVRATSGALVCVCVVPCSRAVAGPRIQFLDACSVVLARLACALIRLNIAGAVARFVPFRTSARELVNLHRRLAAISLSGRLPALGAVPTWAARALIHVKVAVATERDAEPAVRNSTLQFVHRVPCIGTVAIRIARGARATICIDRDRLVTRRVCALRFVFAR